jgi:hypothetical protein
LEKEVTNGVYWRPKNQDFGKRGHQWSVLVTKKVGILEKEVTNGVYWRPKNQDFGKRGHQWSVLAPEKSGF